MSPLKTRLVKYRSKAVTEREKGSYVEPLFQCYFQHEAWERGQNPQDTGIDLVATTIGKFHAILCKLSAPDYRACDSNQLASRKSGRFRHTKWQE